MEIFLSYGERSLWIKNKSWLGRKIEVKWEMTVENETSHKNTHCYTIDDNDNDKYYLQYTIPH